MANGVIAWFLPTAAYLLSPSVATVSENVLLQTINIGLGTLSQMGLGSLSQIGMGTLSQIGLGMLSVTNRNGQIITNMTGHVK